MFAGVFQLPSGIYIKSLENKIQPELKDRIRYHKWYFLKKNLFKGSFNEATHIFRTLFERSIREHLHSDVPVGTALSGGLDSSSIVCDVNRILKTNGANSLQKTFSSCSTYERYCE
jgi:asparagine synthase (glutamine-hydrolysing)